MTGPDFAHAHGDDSSTWTPADIEAQQNLAANDLHTVWVLLHPTPALDCWFCSAPNAVTATVCGFCHHHRDDAPNHTTAA